MDAMGEQRERLRRALIRFRVGYVSAALAGLLPRAAGWLGVALLGYAAADYFLAFSPVMLRALNLLLSVAWILGVLVALMRRAVLTATQAAHLADREGNDRRRRVLTALELTRAAPEDAPLWRYLVTASVDQAVERLRTLSLRHRMPLAQLREDARWAVFGVGVVSLLLAVAWPVASPLLRRIADPAADIPPYSRYRFAITPAEPEVIYGGDVEVEAAIDGAAVRGPVWLLTRERSAAEARALARRFWPWLADAPIRRTACFELGDAHFAQRLEQVVGALEFTFATARARAPWHRVDLRLEPRVALTRLHVTPPVYSRRAPYAFFAGDRPLRDLSGSLVRMDMTSNRPLAAGRLRLGDPAKPEHAVDVTGEVMQPHIVRFEWSLDRNATASVVLTDMRGTPSQKPFELRQVVQPDAPPKAVLTQPPAFSMATPSVVLPVSGHVEDDLGLRSVHLFRGLVGFRDRALPLPFQPGATRLPVEASIDLAALGAEPGQVLEFYLEGMDSNPDLTGLTASQVARVQIISESEYAEALRMRIGVEEFLARYRDALESVRQVEEALAEMESALADAEAGEERLEAELERLRKQMAEAQRKLAALGNDFPVYDIESGLIEQAAAMAADLDVFGKELKQVSAGDSQHRRVVAAMRERLGARQAAMEQEAETAETVAKIGRLMELAAVYQRLLLRQETIVRQLERHADPATMPEHVLRRLAREEAALSEALAAMQARLRERAAELPEDYAALRESAEGFADLLDRLEPIPLLDEAGAAAGRLNGVIARQRAELALERMRAMLSQCEGGFGAMARCDPSFQVRDPRLAPTLRQMLQAWLRRGGSGQGEVGAAGGGMGGDPNDGYWMTGMSLIHTTMFGPERGRYAPATGQGGSEHGSGRGGVGGMILDADAQDRMPGVEAIQQDRSAIQMQRVPDAYREAIRKYFDLDAPEE